MSGTAPPPSAHVRRSKFSLVWVIPLVALAIAVYLGVRTIRSEGPVITLTFKTGDGLVAGQTRVRHKAVELGQVETVRLADDMQTVVVTVKMRREAGPYLTDRARFWVVRARLSSGSISGHRDACIRQLYRNGPGRAATGPPRPSSRGLKARPACEAASPGGRSS